MATRMMKEIYCLQFDIKTIKMVFHKIWKTILHWFPCLLGKIGTLTGATNRTKINESWPLIWRLSTVRSNSSGLTYFQPSDLSHTQRPSWSAVIHRRNEYQYKKHDNVLLYHRLPLLGFGQVTSTKKIWGVSWTFLVFITRNSTCTNITINKVQWVQRLIIFRNDKEK